MIRPLKLMLDDDNVFHTRCSGENGQRDIIDRLLCFDEFEIHPKTTGCSQRPSLPRSPEGQLWRSFQARSHSSQHTWHAVIDKLLTR